MGMLPNEVFDVAQGFSPASISKPKGLRYRFIYRCRRRL